MIRRLSGALAAVAAGLAAPVGATWLEATSKHFIVYSDSNEAGVRRLATRLEQLDGAMRRLHDTVAASERTANRVTVYEVATPSDVAELCGCKDVAGFYVPRASGSVAFTPRSSGGHGITPQTVLFHEYAHHFMLGNYSAAVPAWYSEGYAELVSTAKVEEGGVQFGLGAQHRAQGLFSANSLPIEQLFDQRRRKMDPLSTEQLYGRGWLLTHYLMFNPKRGEQLLPYLRLLNRGRPPLDAARESFGDLRVLDRELDAYLNGRTLPGVRLATTSVPEVTVRRLAPGEAAVVDLRIRSTRGVTSRTAGPLWAKAKRVAGLPAVLGDARAQGWLAEIAFDAGEDAEAEAAADRALALDPTSSQALQYKAHVHLRRAVAAKSKDPAVWREARSWIVKANRQEPDDASPLILYYQSFLLAGEVPTSSAVKGLYRATELVPQDRSVWLAAAVQNLKDGRVDEARRLLRPLAFDPHAVADNPGTRALAALDEGRGAAAALASLSGDKGGSAPAAP
jgi:tetratricopeptide (TPR) repeat protein